MTTNTLPTAARAGAAASAVAAARPIGGFFQRSELGHALWTFRREVAWIAVFSLIANMLMLTPTLYMLQVFDRVMVSGNTLTLRIAPARRAWPTAAAGAG